MSWTGLGYHRGWHGYWESGDHRMYAKENMPFGETKHFNERPPDFDQARTIFRDWAERQ